ncbi:MAG TPA: hypothetical protein VLM83_02085 [Anaerolineales bacterium]|nr:hypothetical protein [Anaerolineales bacterium]
MASEEDLVHLAYTPDLTEAGIAYGLQWLAHSRGETGKLTLTKFQKLVLNKAVELAFRRYLAEQNVPSETVPSTSFTSQGEYALVVAGWRCVLQCIFLPHHESPQHAESPPNQIMQAAALVLSEQVIAWVPGNKDVYIFAFINRQVCREGIQESMVDRPACWLVALPIAWSSPRTQAALGRLVLKVDGSSELQISIGGRNLDQQLVSERMTLLPGQRVSTQYEYNCLVYLHAHQNPANRIGMSSPDRRLSHVVSPKEWINVWVEGDGITLAGYMSHPEFSRRSRRFPSSSLNLNSDRGEEKYRMLTVGELHPLHDLLELAHTETR